MKRYCKVIRVIAHTQVLVTELYIFDMWGYSDDLAIMVRY